MSSVDFRDQLRRQFEFLKNSCKLYDDGCLEEAIRIAVILRVLFHDGLSPSLLTHLGFGNGLVVSTLLSAPGHSEPIALVNTKFIVGRPGTFRATPRLDEAPCCTLVDRKSWWKEQKIFSASTKSDGQVSRRELVLWAANKDGGAHVDTILDVTYQKAIAGLGFAVRYTGEDGVDFAFEDQIVDPLRDLHFASLRQIAYEVLSSPGLLALLP